MLLSIMFYVFWNAAFVDNINQFDLIVSLQPTFILNAFLAPSNYKELPIIWLARRPINCLLPTLMLSK